MPAQPRLPRGNSGNSWSQTDSDLKKKNPKSPLFNRQRDGGQEEERSITRRCSQEEAEGASIGWPEGGVVLPVGDLQSQVPELVPRPDMHGET